MHAIHTFQIINAKVHSAAVKLPQKAMHAHTIAASICLESLESRLQIGIGGRESHRASLQQGDSARECPGGWFGRVQKPFG